MEEGGPSSFSDIVPDDIAPMHQRDVSIPEQKILFSNEFEKEAQDKKGKRKLEENPEEKIIGKGNINLSESYLISLSSISSATNMPRDDNNDVLPRDVHNVIMNKLDFDDNLFRFGGVSQDWRESFKAFLAQFMASPAPLIFQNLRLNNRYVRLLSLFEGKSYELKLPHPSFGMTYDHRLQYVGFSSEFMILVTFFTNKFFLVNPFMRKSHMEIPEVVSPLRIRTWDHAILAFAIGSQNEFTIVAIGMPGHHLFSYQSRIGGWMCYDKKEHIADVVVFHRAIYCIDTYGNVGVVSLNTPRVNFIQFRNAPDMSFCKLKLVVSEGQLLVVQFMDSKKMNLVIYKIDFTMMEWVKLETMGNRALFVSKDRKCYALSNPGTWGYEVDRVYHIDGTFVCKVYGMDGEIVRDISVNGGVVNENNDGVDMLRMRRLRPRPIIQDGLVDWCFRNLRDEVDYSLED